MLSWEQQVHGGPPDAPQPQSFGFCLTRQSCIVSGHNAHHVAPTAQQPAPTTQHLQLSTHHTPFSTQYPAPNTQHPAVTIYHILPTTQHPLPSAHHIPHNTHCPAPSTHRPVLNIHHTAPSAQHNFHNPIGLHLPAPNPPPSLDTEHFWQRFQLHFGSLLCPQGSA